MNAVKTELTVSLPYEGCYVGVEVEIDWTMEDDEPYIHKIAFVDWRDRVETEKVLTAHQFDEAVRDALVKHLEEQARGNECATHEDRSFPRRW